MGKKKTLDMEQHKSVLSFYHSHAATHTCRNTDWEQDRTRLQTPSKPTHACHPALHLPHLAYRKIAPIPPFISRMAWFHLLPSVGGGQAARSMGGSYGVSFRTNTAYARHAVNFAPRAHAPAARRTCCYEIHLALTHTARTHPRAYRAAATRGAVYGI